MCVYSWQASGLTNSIRIFVEIYLTTPQQLKLWAAESRPNEKEATVLVAFLFNNIIPWATACKRQSSYQEHQCDKRLLHSIQESIRNVYAHEINLSSRATCNITNFMRSGEKNCMATFIKSSVCEWKRQLSWGPFCRYVFSSASASLFEAFYITMSGNILHMSVWFLLLTIMFQVYVRSQHVSGAFLSPHFGWNCWSEWIWKN